MTGEQIKRIISGLGYNVSERLQMPEVRALILSTNQGMNYKSEFVTFDSDNELIRIKKFKHTVVSGRLSNSVAINKSELTVNNSIYLRHSIYPFRAPRIGDRILIINEDGSYTDTKLQIIATATNYIKLSGELKNFNRIKQQLCYIDGESFNSAVQDPEVGALFFVYTPISEHTDDVILDLADLMGIEMTSPLLGSV